MRQPADAARVRRLMAALGSAATEDGRCFLVGGGTAVLIGWRNTTIDVDLLLDPEQDEVLRALPAIKSELQVNVELASPRDFIPLPAGWEDRSPSIGREGRLEFRHFDLLSQALAKIERGHTQDLEDVEAMIDRNLVDIERLRAAFDEIEPELYRFPAIDPADYRRRFEEFLR
jgi:hypothetical protein